MAARSLKKWYFLINAFFFNKIRPHEVLYQDLNLPYTY